MNYFEQGLHWFKALSKQQQLSIAAGFIFIIMGTSFWAMWVVSPNLGVLFNHLDSRDANQIITKLEQANIAYQVRRQGSEILIDRQLIDKTRIKLIGSGLQLTGNVGFELFDKTDFGMTDFSQKINYQRALQGELERTINSLDEIKQARVHLVMPENHLFVEQDNLPRAAVTLHLKQALTTQQVKSIQHLICASVPRLPLGNIVIVDQNGNSLVNDNDDTSTTHFAEKKWVEHYLNEKVMHMLNQIFSANRAMVKIDVTLNYDELQRELVKPQRDGLITHEKETQHSISNKLDKTPAHQDFTREKSYQFGREKERFTRANGTIERLTISVVLPQQTEPKKIIQIERLVKSVVGFDDTRGDTISVEALSIEPPPQPAEMVINTTNNTSKLSTATAFVAASGLFLLSIISVWLYLRQRVKRRQLLLNELSQWLIEHG